MTTILPSTTIDAAYAIAVGCWLITIELEVVELPFPENQLGSMSIVSMDVSVTVRPLDKKSNH